MKKVQDGTVIKLKNLTISEWNSEDKQRKRYYKRIHLEHPELNLLSHILDERGNLRENVNNQSSTSTSIVISPPIDPNSTEVATSTTPSETNDRRRLVRTAGTRNEISLNPNDSLTHLCNLLTKSNQDLITEKERSKNLDEELIVKIGRIEIIEKDLRDKTQKISNLETDLNTKTQRITELESDSRNKTQKISNLETDLNSKTLKITELEADSKNKAQRITELEVDLNTKTQRIVELENDLTIEKQKVINLEADSKTKDIKISQLNEKVSKLEDSMSELKCDLKDSQISHKKVLSLNEAYETRLKTLESILENIDDTVGSLITTRIEENNRKIASQLAIESRASATLIRDEVVNGLKKLIKESQIIIPHSRITEDL